MSSTLSILDHTRGADYHADGSKRIYFAAAGINVRGDLPNLLWVATNFPGHKIFLLHVLQPSRLTPYSRYARGIETKTVQENLKMYHRTLRNNGLEGEEVYIKMEAVEEGIVKLIFQHGIKNLVMGAAAREMVYIESKVTKYVSDKGSASCQIWFLHEGRVIKTRYENMITEGGSSMKETYKESLAFGKTEKESIEAACKAPTTENPLSEKMPPVKEKKTVDAMAVNATAIRITPSELERTMDDEFHEQLKQAMQEADNAKIEAFEESLKRQKAEKNAVEAARRAEAAEKIYLDEVRIRQESEDAILKHKQKLEKMGNQLVALMEELNIVVKTKSLLQGEVAESKKTVEELREKIVSSVQMLLSYKNEHDELKVACDNAFRAADALRQQAESAAMLSASLSQFLSEFSYSEIASATCYFHPSLKIDERGSRGIYRGILHHTEVAIKMLYGDSLKGPSEYRLEVDALSRLRHPNIVTLIGVCPEALAIIYEHLPNGTLEDRLNCKDNSSPLSWQTRIRIAFELCSVLIFLHSSEPKCFVHGALNPSNILLDANFTTKISHFGTCRAITTADLTLKYYVNRLGNVLKRMIMQRAADEGFSQSHSPVASCTYIDPEYIITGETTPQLDVYSFGKIILRLLTGKEASGITDKLQRALDEGSLATLLDCSAGDWPYLHAQQLAHIAVRCSDMNRENRPHLESEVLEALRTMKESCQGSSTISPSVGDQDAQPPPYIVCPIYQDVMKDPNVAADGFTYEAEAIQEWINSGHDTSPMTNLTLSHTNLVPNHALRSAIQEWLRHH
ncbi:unnamed protein product [Rhodiola kirilowii]